VSGRFLDGFAHFILAVEVEDIVDKIEGVLVVVNFGVQAGEVEAVGQVFFVDLTKVLVAARGDELADFGLLVLWSVKWVETDARNIIASNNRKQQ
jgi:hypothetical protein